MYVKPEKSFDGVSPRELSGVEGAVPEVSDGGLGGVESDVPDPEPVGVVEPDGAEGVVEEEVL